MDMPTKPYEERKAELLQSIKEVRQDIGKLWVNLDKLETVLNNCNGYNDALFFYPDDVDLEEGLKHIRLI